MSQLLSLFQEHTLTNIDVTPSDLVHTLFNQSLTDPKLPPRHNLQYVRLISRNISINIKQHEVWGKSHHCYLTNNLKTYFIYTK